MVQSSRRFLSLLIVVGVGVVSKPIDDASFDPGVNEPNTGTRRDHRKSFGVESADIEARGRSLTSGILPSGVSTPFSTESKDPDKSNNDNNGDNNGTTTDEKEETTRPKTKTTTTTTTTTTTSRTGEDIDPTTRQRDFGWILAPFIQNVKFSPDSFVRDRIGQLKNTLDNFRSIFPNEKADVESKQLAVPAGGLANLVGLNDSGFYTNRFDPAGFFGGNGWFANKGGLLGGPGALISTGSLFTDYQTAYRK